MKEIGYYQNFGIIKKNLRVFFLDYFGNCSGIFVNFLGPFLGILWEIFGTLLWNCLESHFNIEGIETMVFVKILSQCTRKTKLDPARGKLMALKNTIFYAN